MAEILTPIAPPAPPPGPSVRVSSLLLDWEAQTITIKLRAADNTLLTFAYGPSDGAGAMMIALNKANLSLQSLQNRIFQKLIADGKLPGVISGVPD